MSENAPPEMFAGDLPFSRQAEGKKADPKHDPMTFRDGDGWGRCREVVRPGPVYACGSEIGRIGYKRRDFEQSRRVVCYLCYVKPADFKGQKI